MFPKLICIKEISFRSPNAAHATSIVRDIKTLRSLIQQRDKEKAERATLVKQEKLIHAKVCIFFLLNKNCVRSITFLPELYIDFLAESSAIFEGSVDETSFAWER